MYGRGERERERGREGEREERERERERERGLMFLLIRIPISVRVGASKCELGGGDVIQSMTQIVRQRSPNEVNISFFFTCCPEGGRHSGPGG
jgi:hypothetical protein